MISNGPAYIVWNERQEDRTPGAGSEAKTFDFMKTNPEQNDESLTRSLREWQVSTPLPPRFQERVWQRIADEAASETTTLWAFFQSWLQHAFARPTVAVAYALVLLLLGSSTGYWQAQKKSALIEQSLGSGYIQSVDPYRKTSM